jgi:hypothetical protein
VVDDTIRQWIEEQAVDGEVAALSIEFRRGVGHAVRPAAIAVTAIAAEGGDFDMLMVQTHDDDAEMRAHRLGTGKELDDLLRRGAGGDVVVLRFAPQQHVPHATARQQSGVACLGEFFDDMDCGLAHTDDVSSLPAQSARFLRVSAVQSTLSRYNRGPYHGPAHRTASQQLQPHSQGDRPRLGISEADVAAPIAAAEADGTILGYSAVVDRLKAGDRGVTA